MAVELKIRFALDGASLTRAMRGVNATMAGLSTRVMAPMGAALANTARLGAVVAGAAAAMGGLALRHATDYADGIQKLSDKTGIGTEALSRLQHAAGLADIEVTTLATAFRFSQVAVGEAAAGTRTAQKTFADLGLEYTRLHAMRPEDQFMAVTGALSKVVSQSDRARLATELYGRSGTEMLKLLAGGMDGLRDAMADAGTLGLVVSPEQGKAAAALNDAITRMKGSLTGLGMAFFQAARFTDIVDRITAAVVRLRNSEGFAAFARSFTVAVGRVVQYAEALVVTWNGLSQGHRQSLQNMLATAGAFVLAWKLGFVTPVLKGIGFVLFQTKAGFVAMAGAMTALAGFVVGLKIGRALEEAFNLSGLILRFGACWQIVGRLAVDSAKNIATTIASITSAHWDLVAGDIGIGTFYDRLSDAERKFRKTLSGDMDNAGQWGRDRMAAIAEQDAAMGQLGKSFEERMSIFARRFFQEFSLEGIKADLLDLIPESLRKFLDDFGANLANLPAVPDFSLPKSNLEAAADAAERINGAMVPLRGVLRQFNVAPGLAGAGGLTFPGRGPMPRFEDAGSGLNLNAMPSAIRLPPPVNPLAAAGPMLNGRGGQVADTEVRRNTHGAAVTLGEIRNILNRGTVISFAS